MSSADPRQVAPGRAQLARSEVWRLLLRDPFTIVAVLSVVGLVLGLWPVFTHDPAVREWWALPLGMLLSVAVIWLVLLDHTRVRLVAVAVARVSKDDVWNVLFAQDTAKALREVGVSAWRRVPGWKSGFLTIGPGGLRLWRVHGWGAKPILTISADRVRGAVPIRGWLSDWHSAELPAIELRLGDEPKRIVLFASVVLPSKMIEFQEALVPRISAWKRDAELGGGE